MGEVWRAHDSVTNNRTVNRFESANAIVFSRFSGRMPMKRFKNAKEWSHRRRFGARRLLNNAGGAVVRLVMVFGDDFGVQGRSEQQRELLDAESVAGHLLKPGSVFGFLAAHRRELFADELFADLFPSGRGRPSVPTDVMAAVITLQAMHGLSDSETVDAVTFDLRWKAACGLPVTVGAFHRPTF